MDELERDDRSVLVDDVLVQLQELTDLVGDLAELARGDQQPGAPRAAPPRPAGARRRGAWPNTHGRAKDVTFDLDAEPCWVEATPTASAAPWATCSTTPASGARRARRSRCSAGTGTVVVHDHGPGIAETDLPHIFDRFYRAPAARGLPGSGLGLAIVAQVVKAEGGTIAAENDPGGRGPHVACGCPTVPAPDRRRAPPGNRGRHVFCTLLMDPTRPRCAAHTRAVPPVARSPPTRHRRRRRGGPLRPRRRLPHSGPSQSPRSASLGDELDAVAEGVVDVGTRPGSRSGLGRTSTPAAARAASRRAGRAPRTPGAPCGPGGSPPPPRGARATAPRGNQQPPRPPAARVWARARSPSRPA